jgi:hypothetical protein
MGKKCDGAGCKNWANFGLPYDRKPRWCSGCGRPQGAIYLLVQKARDSPRGPFSCHFLGRSLGHLPAVLGGVFGVFSGLIFG